MNTYEIPPYQTITSERERIELLLQDDFPIVYFAIHSVVFFTIGLIELILVMISKADYGPVSDIGHSVMSASFLVVLAILSLLLSII